MATQPRTFGVKPMRRIVAIEKKPFGSNGGHLVLCKLECGHQVEHLSNGYWKVGHRTGCEDCR